MDQGFDEFFGFTDAVARLGEVPRRTLARPRAEAGLAATPTTCSPTAPSTSSAARRAARSSSTCPTPRPTSTSRRLPTRWRLHRGQVPRGRPRSKPLNATYAAMVTRLDRNVGRVLDALDGLGPGRRHARRLHQRPRRDLRGGEQGHEQLPRQQPARSAARSGRSGRAASACRPSSAGRGMSRRARSPARSST